MQEYNEVICSNCNTGSRPNKTKNMSDVAKLGYLFADDFFDDEYFTELNDYDINGEIIIKGDLCKQL